MRLKRVAAAVCACCLLLLTGCWDSVELNRRAIVSGVSIDKGTSSNNKYSVSFQVIVADEISGKDSRGNSPVILYTGSGRSIYEALSNASRLVARFLSLGHIRVVIISEDIAREGLTDVMKVLERESETRLTTLFFVSKNQPAKDILSTMTVLGRIPANDLVGKLETTSKSFGYNFTVQIDDIIRGITLPGAGPIINGVQVTGDTKESESIDSLKTVVPNAMLKVSEFAVFRGDRFADWLDGDTARGSALMLNKIKQSSAIIETEDSGILAFDVFQNKSQTVVEKADPEHPEFKVLVTQQASLKDSSRIQDLTNPKVLKELEKKVGDYTAQQLKLAIERSKEVKSDYLGFGEVFERENPGAWKKMKERWDILYPDCKIDVEVKVLIQHTDVRSNSIQM